MASWLYWHVNETFIKKTRLFKHYFTWQNQPNDNVRPVKTQISLGICPVWSESSLSTWRNLGSLATHWAHSKDWPDWVVAQVDLRLRWAHMLLCWFCHAAAQSRHSTKHNTSCEVTTNVPLTKQTRTNIKTSKTRGPLVLYRSPECWWYADWRAMAFIGHIKFTIFMLAIGHL